MSKKQKIPHPSQKKKYICIKSKLSNHLPTNRQIAWEKVIKLIIYFNSIKKHNF